MFQLLEPTILLDLIYQNLRILVVWYTPASQPCGVDCSSAPEPQIRCGDRGLAPCCVPGHRPSPGSILHPQA